MPVQIIRSQRTYSEADAVVRLVRPGKRGLFFGPRAGRVSAVAADPERKTCEIQVIYPEKGSKAAVRRCYNRCLALAAQKGLRCVALPLLGEDWGISGEQALRIAMESIGDFLNAHDMLIYLTVPEEGVARIPETLRMSLSAYIARKNIGQLWGTSPFQSDESKFDTAAPRPAPPMAAQSLPPIEMPRPSRPKPAGANLGSWIPQPDAGFSETLLKLIDQTGKKDSEIYNRANVSRQHFSKIRNNPDYKPTKPTAIAFAVALELDMEQTRDLIGRAGYALTTSSTFDLIIMYFIEQHNYNLHDINMALFEFDQSLLGV
jgi:hypothetical protein